MYEVLKKTFLKPLQDLYNGKFLQGSGGMAGMAVGMMVAPKTVTGQLAGAAIGAIAGGQIGGEKGSWGAKIALFLTTVVTLTLFFGKLAAGIAFVWSKLTPWGITISLIITALGVLAQKLWFLAGEEEKKEKNLNAAKRRVALEREVYGYASFDSFRALARLKGDELVQKMKDEGRTLVDPVTGKMITAEERDEKAVAAATERASAAHPNSIGSKQFFKSYRKFLVEEQEKYKQADDKDLSVLADRAVWTQAATMFGQEIDAALANGKISAKQAEKLKTDEFTRLSSKYLDLQEKDARGEGEISAEELTDMRKMLDMIGQGAKGISFNQVQAQRLFSLNQQPLIDQLGKIFAVLEDIKESIISAVEKIFEAERKSFDIKAGVAKAMGMPQSSVNEAEAAMAADQYSRAKSVFGQLGDWGRNDKQLGFVMGALDNEINAILKGTNPTIGDPRGSGAKRGGYGRNVGRLQELLAEREGYEAQLRDFNDKKLVLLQSKMFAGEAAIGQQMYNLFGQGVFRNWEDRFGGEQLPGQRFVDTSATMGGATVADFLDSYNLQPNNPDAKNLFVAHMMDVVKRKADEQRYLGNTNAFLSEEEKAKFGFKDVFVNKDTGQILTPEQMQQTNASDMMMMTMADFMQREFLRMFNPGALAEFDTAATLKGIHGTLINGFNNVVNAIQGYPTQPLGAGGAAPPSAAGGVGPTGFGSGYGPWSNLPPSMQAGGGPPAPPVAGGNMPNPTSNPPVVQPQVGPSTPSYGAASSAGAARAVDTRSPQANIKEMTPAFNTYTPAHRGLSTAFGGDGRRKAHTEAIADAYRTSAMKSKFEEALGTRSDAIARAHPRRDVRGGGANGVVIPGRKNQLPNKYGV